MAVDAFTAASFEAAARMFEAPARRWSTPGQMARALLPDTRQTPALDLIDEALVRAVDAPDGRLIISMPPQEGKSTRAAKDFPIWALTQNPTLRIVTASYAQGLANRNGRAIRNTITANPQLGLTMCAPEPGVAGTTSGWAERGARTARRTRPLRRPVSVQRRPGRSGITAGPRRPTAGSGGTTSTDAP